MKVKKRQKGQEKKEVLSVEQLYNILVFEFLAFRKTGGR